MCATVTVRVNFSCECLNFCELCDCLGREPPNRSRLRRLFRLRMEERAASSPEVDDNLDDEQLLDSLGLSPPPAKASPNPRHRSVTATVEAPTAPESAAKVQDDVAPPSEASPEAETTIPSGEAETTIPSGACHEAVDANDDLAEGYDGREQTYAAFRQLLGLPPSVTGTPEPIPQPPIDPMAALQGAMIMDAKKRRDQAATHESPHTPPPAPVALRAQGGAHGADDDLDGVDAIELAPGGTRDVTKSPQHHLLQMDTWIPQAEDSDDEQGGAGTESGGQPQQAQPDPCAGQASTPPTKALGSCAPGLDASGARAAAAAFAADEDPVSEEEGDWTDSPPEAAEAGSPGSPSEASSDWVEVSPPGSSAPGSAPAASPATSPAADLRGEGGGGAPDAVSAALKPPEGCDPDPAGAASEPGATDSQPTGMPTPPPAIRAAVGLLPAAGGQPMHDDGVGEPVTVDGVVPFQLDEDFDYDNVPQTERFSVARARAEGEFYDRDR